MFDFGEHSVLLSASQNYQLSSWHIVPYLKRNCQHSTPPMENPSRRGCLPLLFKPLPNTPPYTPWKSDLKNLILYCRISCHKDARTDRCSEEESEKKPRKPFPYLHSSSGPSQTRSWDNPWYSKSFSSSLPQKNKQNLPKLFREILRQCSWLKQCQYL